VSVETNLGIIAKLAPKRWAENWQFRDYLRAKVDPAQIDAVAIRLSREVSAAIDCRECGNCCRSIQPGLEVEDIAAVAEAVGLSNKSFDEQFLMNDPEGAEVKVFNCLPCPMLEGNLCKVYAFRPRDCREYPHLDKSDFLGNAIAVIENYRICPIVVNVYEKMKGELGFVPPVDSAVT